MVDTRTSLSSSNDGARLANDALLHVSATIGSDCRVR